MKLNMLLSQLLATILYVHVRVASPQGLTSSLNGRSMAYPQQVVLFTCVTRDSPILAWSSGEYIGHGVQLEFTSADQPGSIIRSNINPDTIATLVAITVESNEVVLQSTLRINASQTSSITCHHVGNGRVNTTTFRVADVPAQEVNCTLRHGLSACPGDRLNFTCRTRDSPILAWSSDEYIGQNNPLEFLIIDDPGVVRLSSVDPNTVAVLMSVSYENGIPIITCNLSIAVLSSIVDHNHSVMCMNVGVGTMHITTFTHAEKCGGSTMTVFTSESIQTTTTERSSYFELSKGTNIAKKGGVYLTLLLILFELNWMKFVGT